MPTLTELIARETSKRTFVARGKIRVRAPKDADVHIVRRHKILQNLAGKYVGKLDKHLVALEVERQLGASGSLNRAIYRYIGPHLPQGSPIELLNRYYPEHFDTKIVPTDTLISAYCGIADNRLPDGRRFAKFLGQKDVPETVIQDIVRRTRVSQTVEFELSVRYKDLLRMADTNHFDSCFASWRGGQKLRYLADNCIAIALIRDSKGDFQSRSLVRLLEADNKEVVLGCNRIYGNGLTMDILASGLAGKIRVFSIDNDHYIGRDEIVALRTFGKDFTGVGRKYIWEDSPHHKDKMTGQIAFNGREIK